MSDDIMLSLLNNNRPNHKPPPPCSFNDGGGGSAPAAGLNPLVKPFAPGYFSGETVNPLHAALRAARARAEQQVPVSVYAGGNFPTLQQSSSSARLRHSSSSYTSRSSGSPPPRPPTRSVAASFPPPPPPLSAVSSMSSSRQMTLPRKHSSSSFSVGSPSVPTTRDDFGLAGLGRAIEATRTLSLSNTKTAPSLYLSSVLSMEDLGLPHHVRSSVRNLHEHMESPFYDQLANTLNSSDEVPDEYLMPSNKSASLPRPNSSDFHWCTDTLFFLFYLAPRDSLQLHAAAKLFEKGWRYNMVSKVWLARWPGVSPEFRTASLEKGTYQFFDVGKWTITPCNMVLKYSELAGPSPPLPVSPQRYNGGAGGYFQQHQQQQQSGNMYSALNPSNSSSSVSSSAYPPLPSYYAARSYV